MAKCDICGKNKTKNEFMPSTSPFWPQGHINICYSCVEALVDGNDLNQVDRLLQHCNMAFMPQEWRKIWIRENTNAFRKYGTMYQDFNYFKYDWSEQNEQLMEVARQGLIENELEELRPALLKKLERTWGELPENDLLWLERYYNQILSDYDVQEETQRDMFRKICHMSLAIDKNLKKGLIDKDFMTQYNTYMTSVLKNMEKKQTNAITTVGQIVEFIERNGYKANFYDGIPRDEIDMMIENIKEYIADLVRGEANLPAIYAQQKQKYDSGQADLEEVAAALVEEEEEEPEAFSDLEE